VVHELAVVHERRIARDQLRFEEDSP
jgi:hypothetical protein